MKRLLHASLALALAGIVATAAAQSPRVRSGPKSAPRSGTKFTPRFSPVAETKLLMDGLAQPNYRALEEMIKKRPDDVEAWTLVRGQALLIAETGNLLLIRPPRNAGQESWFRRAMELRDAATDLARAAGASDLTEARVGLVNLAGACNRCHQTFRVPVRIGPPSAARPVPEPPLPQN